MSRVYNFSAGPAVLPEEVLKEAAAAIGIDDRAGTLDVGKAASLVLLDQNDLSTRAIVFKGKTV